MSENIIVRRAVPDDLPSLRLLMEQLCETQNVPFNEKRFTWGVKKRLFDRLQKQGFVVAEDSKTHKLLGMIFAELIIDPLGSAEGYIRTVVVDVHARGRNIGKTLLQTSLDYLKEMNVDVIRINSKDRESKYFASFGFRPTYTVMELRMK